GEALWGALAMGGCAALVVALGFAPMLNINGLITAFLCVLIAGVGVGSALKPAIAPSGPEALAGAGWAPGTWYASAALYGAYNLTYGFALFGALGSGIRSNMDARAGGLVGGAVLALLSLFVCISVQRTLPEAADFDIPMLAAVEPFGRLPVQLYVA